MTLLIVAYSSVPTCLWPGVALIVSSNILGTAYGVLASLLNCGSFISPLIITSIQQSTKSYEKSIWFLMALGIISVVLSFIAYLLDKRGEQILENTSIIKESHTKQ